MENIMKISSLSKYASGVTALAAILMATACSGTVPSTPNTQGNSFTPSTVRVSESHAPGSVKPDIGPCLYTYTEWIEVSYSPEEWELVRTGEFCGTTVLWGPCTGSESHCDFQYIMTHPIRASQSSWTKYFALAVKCNPCFVDPSGPNGVSAVAEAKHALNIDDVLSVNYASNTGAGVVAVALDTRRQVLYASVTNTSETAGVLVYPAGSKSPTEFLTVKESGITVGAGVTVDSQGNVYWAFDDESGSGHIAKFAGGKGSATVLNLTGFSGAAGDLELDRRDDLVVSSPSQESIQLYAGIKSGKLKQIGTFSVTGAPTSISLDAKNKNLYVADTTNNLIDQYSYPSGTLLSSNQPPTVNGVEPVLATVTAPDAQDQ
jgi:hypothetical protein